MRSSLKRVDGLWHWMVSFQGIPLLWGRAKSFAEAFETLMEKRMLVQ